MTMICYTFGPVAYWTVPDQMKYLWSLDQTVVYTDQSQNTWINAPGHSVHHDKSFCCTRSNFPWQISGQVALFWRVELPQDFPLLCWWIRKFLSSAALFEILWKLEVVARFLWSFFFQIKNGSFLDVIWAIKVTWNHWKRERLGRKCV